METRKTLFKDDFTFVQSGEPPSFHEGAPITTPDYQTSINAIPETDKILYAVLNVEKWSDHKKQLFILNQILCQMTFPDKISKTVERGLAAVTTSNKVLTPDGKQWTLMYKEKGVYVVFDQSLLKTYWTDEKIKTTALNAEEALDVALFHYNLFVMMAQFGLQNIKGIIDRIKTFHEESVRFFASQYAESFVLMLTGMDKSTLKSFWQDYSDVFDGLYYNGVSRSLLVYRPNYFGGIVPEIYQDKKSWSPKFESTPIQLTEFEKDSDGKCDFTKILRVYIDWTKSEGFCLKAGQFGYKSTIIGNISGHPEPTSEIPKEKLPANEFFLKGENGKHWIIKSGIIANYTRFMKSCESNYNAKIIQSDKITLTIALTEDVHLGEVICLRGINYKQLSEFDETVKIIELLHSGKTQEIQELLKTNKIKDALEYYNFYLRYLEGRSYGDETKWPAPHQDFFQRIAISGPLVPWIFKPFKIISGTPSLKTSVVLDENSKLQLALAGHMEETKKYFVGVFIGKKTTEKHSLSLKYEDSYLEHHPTFGSATKYLDEEFLQKKYAVKLWIDDLQVKKVEALPDYMFIPIYAISETTKTLDF